MSRLSKWGWKKGGFGQLACHSLVFDLGGSRVRVSGLR